MLGHYAAMYIVQGGHGFPILHPNVYNYMVTGKYIGIHTPDVDVPNPTVVALLQDISLNTLTSTRSKSIASTY